MILVILLWYCYVNHSTPSPLSDMADGPLDDEVGSVESKPKSKVSAQLSQSLTDDPANVVANVKAEVN